jgi:hypothetical protein
MDDEREAARPDDENEDVQEQEAIEHTEKTGEVAPSALWPEGDPDTRTPV